jgi:hypothetical protein
MDKNFYHPDHDPRVYYRQKVKEMYKKDMGNVYKHFMVEPPKPVQQIPLKFPKYHNKYSMLNPEFAPIPRKKSLTSYKDVKDLPESFSDHRILRMLKVGKNAIFGTDVKSVDVIKKEMKYPKEAQLKFKPIPHNHRSTANMLNYAYAKNTYISDSMKNMGKGPGNFVSGVLNNDDRYIKNGHGNRRMY